MQAVAAVKMRRSEEVALSARPFAHAALEILRNVTASIGNERALSPFLRSGKGEKPLLVVVTSDKGLAGSLNTNVLRVADTYLKNATQEVSIVAVGKKGRDYYTRRGKKVIKEFVDFGDSVKIEEVQPLTAYLKNQFIETACDEVLVIYTNFITALRQEVITRRLLPFDRKTLQEIVEGIAPLQGKYSGPTENLGQENREFVFEPSPQEVLSELLPLLFDIEMYQAILEANASEHSSRMVAMKNASENASELITELTILYNKSRQAQITRELSEITAGTEALANAN